MLVASASIESIYLDLVHRNLSDFPSLNTFYRNLLQEVRQHRIIDTVQSPINVSTIRSRNYDDGYLKNSVGLMRLINVMQSLLALVLRIDVRPARCSRL